MANHSDSTESGLEIKPNADALSVALDAVSDRWSLHIVRVLALGAHRYTEMIRALGIPRDVLAGRLRRLTEEGIVRPVPGGAGGRPRGYELTEKGNDLGQVILVLKRWGDRYGAPDLTRRTILHVQCGHPFVADVRCQECGHGLGVRDLQSPEAT
ncbi:MULTISPECIES: helix-turn-helix domain-containing protein [unclassified Rathayibacter]|uniref:winged helix-turn-helix transcriptional regulator n=1 Tax=unclassified Rathayibacter TaxID=2609250 RepID=UPI001FB42FA1|nr:MULTISPECIES: winged helix-turn-helix transcriptional regulator [unclassified Rathayibacter]MCJ1674608.1 winged helix-turn-helix transcriptional regulator [Rathayibacter sp. VKM Ac-2929]MCJ1684888.1 winged helix-turn-helix transcriptional regulator [Rathayibacter sp. VKM Ac-2928]